MIENGPALQNLLEKILAERGFDFREYRESTLLRRISRRLRFCGVETCEEYGCLLDRDPDEYDRLFNDLTINVSRFFRDRAAFDALAKTVLPNILESNQDRTVRVWSAGCARGEEAYSVCMLLHDVLGENTHRWNIQIQCTDLDPKAVLSAESGIFTQKDMDRVPSRFSEAFFTRREDDYVVSSKLKQSMRFCVHDLAKTPPFQDQDLILCRNVLIYFTRALQVRVLNHLHDALKSGGCLFLGKAEIPVAETATLFKCHDDKTKLYQKIR